MTRPTLWRNLAGFRLPIHPLESAKLCGLVADGSDYGLSNVSQACGAVINACDPATALFYDGQHPTAYGHRLIADLVFTSAVPEPSSAVLLLLGGVCVLARRRRQAEPA